MSDAVGTALVVIALFGPPAVAVWLGAILIRDDAAVRATVRRRRVPLVVGGVALLVTALIIPVGFVAAGVLAFRVRRHVALKAGVAALFAVVGILGIRDELSYCEQQSGCIPVGIVTLWPALITLAFVLVTGAIAVRTAR